MRARKHWRRLAGALGLIAVLVGGLLWGATATGQVAYVTTLGTSMAPGFHQGDLAVVHPSDSYEVGDIVAYRSRLLDTVVLHRIVAQDGDRYILKGDNNSWLDADQPTKADLIGALLVHVPRASGVINWIRARLLFLAAAMVVLGAGAGTATRQHRRNRRKGPSTAMPLITRSRLHGWCGVAVGLGVLTVVCAAVGLAAYTRPATETLANQVAYTQTGEFSYSAAAPPGPVYVTGKVTTGDPVYLRLVRGVDVDFTYSFTSDKAQTASGTIALDAEVADGTGWVQRVELQPATPFHGVGANARGHLAVVDLQALVAQVRAATGVQGGTPTITVLPDIRVDATVADTLVSDRFQPRLQFQVDPQQMRRTAPPAKNGATTADDELRPHSKSTVTRSSPAPARLEFMGRGLAVSHARRLGLLAFPAALGALASAVALRRRLRAETSRIELRHGHRIVPVAGAAREGNVATIDVTTMQDLARLAEQEDRLILHQQTDRGDVYLFQTDRTIYRYTVLSTASPRPVMA
jgi:signal peptidase I